MIAAVLGLAWAGVVAGAVVRGHGVVRRAEALRHNTPARGRPRRLSRPQRIVLGALVLVAVSAAFGPAPTLAAAGASVAAARAWPSIARGRAARRRLARLEAELPEVVDLLVLAIGAGLNVPLAIDAVCRATDGDLRDELAAVLVATRHGHRLADALDTLPARAGEAVRPLVAALVASERYGAPLGPGLERLSDEVRAGRRRRADIAARQVSVKLLFPLVLCILPAFALLTVAPLIASALRSLRL